MDEFTRKFNAAEDKEQQVHHILTSVYESLKEKGYDPINQIVGYILSEDPTYITNHNSARSLICKIDRSHIFPAAPALTAPSKCVTIWLQKFSEVSSWLKTKSPKGLSIRTTPCAA